MTIIARKIELYEDHLKALMKFIKSNNEEIEIRRQLN